MSALPQSPIPAYRGRFDVRAATRLLWRAGFGPRPGQAEHLASLGLDGAVASLTRPRGAARLTGPQPSEGDGVPIDPINVWGDAHLWWLDRMVRSDQQLIERMTLVWHSWFATSTDTSTAALMLEQNAMMRRGALGSFHQMLLEVTADPAMLLWLNGVSNNKWSPNENYGREMLELFTLGADNGYDQDDVHENARALTGFTTTWTEAGYGPFVFDPTLHDDGVKKIFGHRGRFNWRDSCRLAVTHPDHPAFFVGKLWGYFIGADLPPRTGRVLQNVYVRSGFEVRPVIEAILRHPLLYEGPRLVTPPVVFCAGLMRATGQGVQSNAWSWMCSVAGQMLFYPPNVSGWDYGDWLDTARWNGRLDAVNHVLDTAVLDQKTYPARESVDAALERALAFWGNPQLTHETMTRLRAYSTKIARLSAGPWDAGYYRWMRQNGLRALIAMSPDWQAA